MMTEATQKKRVCISFRLDSEEILHQIASFTKYKKSDVMEAAAHLFFETIGYHDGMTIAELKNSLNSFFKEELF